MWPSMTSKVRLHLMKFCVFILLGKVYQNRLINEVYFVLNKHAYRWNLILSKQKNIFLCPGQQFLKISILTRWTFFSFVTLTFSFVTLMYFYGSKNQERVFKISLTPLPRRCASIPYSHHWKRRTFCKTTVYFQ